MTEISQHSYMTPGSPFEITVSKLIEGLPPVTLGSVVLGTACGHTVTVIATDYFSGAVTFQHGANPEHRTTIPMVEGALDEWLDRIHARTNEGTA